jgi:hypothetical protein
MDNQKWGNYQSSVTNDTQHVADNMPFGISGDYHDRLLTGGLSCDVEQFTAMEEITFIQSRQLFAALVERCLQSFHAAKIIKK